MENIKMKTGISIPDEPSDNIKTFLLTFMCIIWRRVWITTAIYCEHNSIKINKDTVLKSLKYNIFSKAGIGNVLQPYITKALTDGFLMPQFYKKNLYATRAVKLFKPAYEIIRKKDKEAELNFLKDYALSVFKPDPAIVSAVKEETKDTLKDIGSSDPSDPVTDPSKTDPVTDPVTDPITDPSEHNSLFPGKIMERCPCKLCELVDSWDVNMDLVFSDDPFQNIVMKGLSDALTNIK